MSDLIEITDLPMPFDAVLSRICTRCPRLSDEAITLREGLVKKCSPGGCARAFFELAREAGPVLPREVSLVGRVVRQRLGIEVFDAGDRPLETVDFEPDPEEDLEGFCQRTMRTFYWDRSYGPEPLRLRFCFR